MKNTPLVSIGMPAFNGQENIRTALDSLLAQTYTHFELIISDDASIDQTKTICANYANKDRRIRYIRQKNNGGFVKNFNVVLSLAKGDYFMWASQDDLWDKHFIETLVSLLQKNKDALLAMSNYQNIYKDKKYFVYKQEPFNNSWNRYQSLQYFLKTTNLSFFYGLHKTDSLKKAGGYHTDARFGSNSSDYITIFRILLLGKMVYSSEVLFFKRDTGLYTNRYDAVKRDFFSKKTQDKVKRFFFYPLFYILDSLFCIRYLTFTDIGLLQKLKLYWYILMSLGRRLYGFVLDAAHVVL